MVDVYWFFLSQTEKSSLCESCEYNSESSMDFLLELFGGTGNTPSYKGIVLDV